MPLPLANVNLDDRRWADLVEEGQALIPRYAPVWSDHNLSDPGITLIELFAWLTEQSVYRLNQVPERHRLKFLGLIGHPPQPPQPAQAVLAVQPWDLDPVLIPSGLQFEARDEEGKAVAWRTLRDLNVAPVALTTVQLDPGDGALRDRARDWRDGLSLAVFGAEPRVGAAMYLGFEQIPAQTRVSLAFHFDGPETDTLARVRLINEAGQQHAASRPVLPDIRCDEGVQDVAPGLPPHHSARVVWEVFAEGEVWIPLHAVNEPPSPGQVWDDTRSVTLNGIVEFNLPESLIRGNVGAVTAPLYYLRCRLEAASYDAAPLLSDLSVNAVPIEQAVPVEHRFVISASATIDGLVPVVGDVVCVRMAVDSAGMITRLRFLGRESEDALGHPRLAVLAYVAPVAGTPGSLTLDVVALGLGAGLPGQALTLPQAPVQRSGVTLYTHVDDQWHSWILRDDLDASCRADRHFTLDATTGVLRFGDGERGQVPEADVLILARYHVTRAEAGNLKVGSTFSPANTARNTLASLSDDIRQRLGEVAHNPVEGSGGAAAETLAQATGRVLEILHAHERLVALCAENKRHTLDQMLRSEVMAIAPPTRGLNLLDLERLALVVPGTRVARARAWAGIHPSYPCLHAAGVVTVVVLPHIPARRPEPSAGLLGAVRRYLNRRRMLTTRLEVVGPHYLTVDVIADVRSKPYVDGTRVRAQILHAIDVFLDPLHGGPDGLGWPFGRDVYRSEILQLIDGVPGVDHVLDLALVGGDGEPRCGNVSLCSTWLVSSGEHQIRINPPTDARSFFGAAIPPCPTIAIDEEHHG